MNWHFEKIWFESEFTNLLYLFEIWSNKLIECNILGSIRLHNAVFLLVFILVCLLLCVFVPSLVAVKAHTCWLRMPAVRTKEHNTKSHRWRHYLWAYNFFASTSFLSSSGLRHPAWQHSELFCTQSNWAAMSRTFKVKIRGETKHKALNNCKQQLVTVTHIHRVKTVCLVWFGFQMKRCRFAIR